MTKARDLANAGTALTTVSATELGYLDGVTSAVQTQLNQKPEYAAGKNKVINGDFGVWQRGTSFTGALNNVFGADRWNAIVGTSVSGLSWTVSQQTFTPGTAPIAGYEGTFFLRADISTIGSATFPSIRQKIEDVRTFANQAVTLSWFGRSSTSTTITSGARVIQNFGTGGSTAVDVTASNVVYTTSWQRFSRTFTMSSVSGKTIGAGSSIEIRLLLDGVNGANLDIWGVQIEAGSTATPFQTATGNVQGELAACQRYYQKLDAAGATNVANGFNDSTTSVSFVIPFVSSMRTNPTALETTGTVADYLIRITGGTTVAPTAITFSTATKNTIAFTMTAASGLTGGQAVQSRYASSAGYFAWSAEL